MTVISGTPSSGRAPALKPLKFLFPPQLHPQYSKNSTCSIPSVTNLGLSSKEAISCNQRDSQSLAFLLRFCSYYNNTPCCGCCSSAAAAAASATPSRIFKRCATGRKWAGTPTAHAQWVPAADAVTYGWRERRDYLFQIHSLSPPSPPLPLLLITPKRDSTTLRERAPGRLLAVSDGQPIRVSEEGSLLDHLLLTPRSGFTGVTGPISTAGPKQKVIKS